MAFTTALSGLNAASNNLAVTGNNIANANTTGFKKSRSEFVDVYAASLAGVSKTTAGAGVRVANVAQQFLQGNLAFTDNNLDLAISGEGFFTMGKSPTETTDLSYSRAGEFKLDKDGYLVNNQGNALLVYRPNGPEVADGFSTGVTQPVQINTLTGLPTATETVSLTVNLDATGQPHVPPTAQQISNATTAVTVAQAAATTSQTAVTSAQAAVTSSQSAYDAALLAAAGDTTDSGVIAAQTQLTADQATLTTAQSDLTAKQTTLANAQTALSTLNTFQVFDPANPNSYNSQTSSLIYDSLGSPHVLTTYFVKGASTNATTDWSVYHYMSEPESPDAKTPLDAGAYGSPVPPNATTVPVPGVMTFDSSGKLQVPANGRFALSSYTMVPATGAAPIEIAAMDFFGSTQVQEKFSVNSMTQDGLAAGRLTGIDIDDQGVIFARFSNGGAQTMGKVALTRFPNNNGLAKLGNTAWGQSANSGEPIRGEPGSNNFGLIQSGALEGSNVDLSAQLVNLIIAQQAYQANAQTITTENTIMQTILNIR